MVFAFRRPWLRRSPPAHALGGCLTPCNGTRRMGSRTDNGILAPVDQQRDDQVLLIVQVLDQIAPMGP